MIPEKFVCHHCGLQTDGSLFCSHKCASCEYRGKNLESGCAELCLWKLCPVCSVARPQVVSLFKSRKTEYSGFEYLNPAEDCVRCEGRGVIAKHVRVLKVIRRTSSFRNDNKFVSSEAFKKLAIAEWLSCEKIDISWKCGLKPESIYKKAHNIRASDLTYPELVDHVDEAYCDGEKLQLTKQ